jgi:outer membrane lipase/esterase
MTFKTSKTARWGQPLAVIAAAALLVACGGGSPRTTAVKVVGDSLNDSGTFGFKFTVQGTTAAPHLIWAEHVTSAVGAPALCARYAATGPTSVALNPAAAQCTSYGVGGGRVNPAGLAGDTSAFSVVQQLKDMAAAGSFGPEELLLADGGGNDAADLVGAYLGAATDGGAAYVALLSELLTPTQVGTAVAGGSAGLAVAGGQYMTAAANLLADTLNTQAIDKGAQRVVLLTAPNVVRTPRFQQVLAGVAAASGGGATGAAAAAQVAALADGWVVAFNTQLKARFASQSKVAVVDSYAEFNKWLDTPATYGLTNTTTPACPVTGVESNGLPSYSIQTCTAAGLSASPQPGTSGADWWKTYVFSDNFHGTPRTNQLLGELVVKALESKGWK